MTSQIMSRQRHTFSIDEPVLDALKRLHKKAGTRSLSVYVEKLLAAHAIACHEVPPTYELPGETRGGDRGGPATQKGFKRKKQTPIEDTTDAT